MQGNYSEFQIGNWVIYLPERNYCTIKSLSPKVVLEGPSPLYTYTTTIEHIGKIRITRDRLQVCGFEVDYPIFKKKSNNEIDVALFFSSSEVYKLCKNGQKFCDVEFIHQVQNAYYKITGELLKGNLYGVREE